MGGRKADMKSCFENQQEVYTDSDQPVRGSKEED